MSQVGFSIYKDDENRDAVRKPRASKLKVMDQKRLPLGVSNENTNIRVQQPRGAKQQRPVLKINDENSCASKKATSQSGKVSAACMDTKKGGRTTLAQINPKDLKKEKNENTKDPKEKKAKDALIVTKEPEIEEVVLQAKDIEIIDLESIEEEEESKENQNVSPQSVSLDSIVGSPMSVDRSLSVANRTFNLQEAEEKFYSVIEYQEEIFTHLLRMEERYRPKAGYMRKQPDITYNMRSILVDWLVEVNDEYNLHAETLFLAVGYIDRFLSYMSVVRGKLQLVGTAAMFIASKFEEIYPPDVAEFVYITDDTYTKKQVLRMEHLILKVLSFDMASPTILRFATKYNMVANSSVPVTHLTQYLCELSLLDGEKFMHFLPSVMAAAATALARHTFGMEAWPRALQELTGMSLAQLGSCLDPLTITFEEAANYPQQAIREKFRLGKWSSVGLMSPRKPTLVSLLPKPAAEVTPTKESANC